MSFPTSTLPTPRGLLTSLITTLTNSDIQSTTNRPQTQNETQKAIVRPYDPPANPLKSLSPSHRALLSTLHVLLPTGVLLQSLDLLERGLVLRVVEEYSIEENKDEADGAGRREKKKEKDIGRVVPPQAHVHLSPSESQRHDQGQGQSQARIGLTNQLRNISAIEAKGKESRERRNSFQRKRTNFIYHVRSSQASKSRFKDLSMSAGNLIYTVQLQSWNCSCAAFAFDSFPGSSLANDSKPWLELEEEIGECYGENEGPWETRKEEWEFGGVSFDGDIEEGHVPVCKHLLACLLAERREDTLGSYVKERAVGRKEMAGVGGER